MEDCSIKQEHNDSAIQEVNAGRLSVMREEDRVQRSEGNERRANVRRLTSFERFLCERENLVFDFLIYLEPVKR